MSNSFDARSLLNDLPELLSGTSPVIETAQARAALVQDPAARAALLLAGGVAGAMSQGASKLAIDPKDVPVRLRTGAKLAARSFGRVLASSIYDLGLYFLDRMMEADGEALVIVGPRIGGAVSAMPDVKRDRLALNEVRALLGARSVVAVEAFLRLAEDQGNERALARGAMAACDALIPGMDEPDHVRMLADPGCSGDPLRWLDASRRRTTTLHIGASIQEAGVAHASRGEFGAAVLANAEARGFLGENATLAMNGLLHAACAADERAAMDWAVELAKALGRVESGGGLQTSVTRAIRSGSSLWKVAARESASLLRAIGRDLPADVSGAIAEVTL